MSIFLSQPNLPKYRALSVVLEQAIAKGKYTAGDRLPSERELARNHHITPVTVRQALAVLQDKGLIMREQGRGTFVRATRPQSDARSAQPPRIYLLGLDGDISADKDPVNWQVQLRLFQGLVDASFDQGMQLVSKVALRPGAKIEEVRARLHDAAGVLLAAESLSETAIIALREAGIPVVTMSYTYGTFTCCSHIQVDARAGARQAVEHLLKLGHRRIGLIVGDLNKVAMKLRFDGYHDALALAGIEAAPELIEVDSRGLRADGAAAAERLLERAPGVSAIFCVSDSRALGVLDFARERNLQIPQDLSVVGFDDIREASLCKPPLTTVANPLYERGRQAIELLARQIRNRNTGMEVRVLPMHLTIRQSTCTPTTK